MRAASALMKLLPVSLSWKRLRLYRPVRVVTRPMREGLRSPLDSWCTSLGCSTQAWAATMIMPGGDVVHRDHVQDQRLLDRQHVLPLERQVDQRRRGGEALVPAGEGVALRALDDGRADDGADDVRSRGPPAGRPCSWCRCRCWASPSSAARLTPRSVSSWRTQSLRSRATASFSDALVVGIAPLLFQAVRGPARAARAITWASSAWARTSAAMRSLSAISCSTVNLVAGSSRQRGK